VAKFQELGEELKLVLAGRGKGLLDSFLPLLVFLVLNSFLGLNPALVAALGLAALMGIIRILRHESLVYALGGLGGLALAAVFAYLSGSGKGFFLPGLISGSITVVLCVASVAVNRPAAAWSSYLARRWPLEWYWHPRVLPAYNEVSIGWGVAFAARLALEFWLYQSGEVNTLGAARIFLGWPFIIVLLILSYLYGTRRLSRSGGPSVKEFKEGKEPPWEGQLRGF
jgi:hypothetical protein